MGNVHEDQYTFFYQTKVVEKIKTLILYSVTFFFIFRKACRL
jgi:hypothetical protein